MNSTSDSGALGSRPVVPGGVQEVFLPASLSLEAAAQANKRELPAGAKRLGLAYRPAILAQAQVRFLQRKYNLDIESKKAALVTEVPERGLRWEDFEHEALDERKLEGRPQDNAGFGELSGVLANESQLKLLERDFADWAYRTSEVQMWANDGLKVYGGPELTREQFLAKVEQEAQTQREAEVERSKLKFDTKLKNLHRKLEKEKRELSSDEAEAGQRKMEEMGTHLENVIGLFAGSRRRLTTSLTKRRLTAEAVSSVQESKATIAELEKEMQDLGEEVQDAMEDVHNRWDAAAQAVTQVALAPARNDVYVSTFGVAWLPYHQVSVGGREVEIPAFE